MGITCPPPPMQPPSQAMNSMKWYLGELAAFANRFAHLLGIAQAVHHGHFDVDTIDRNGGRFHAVQRAEALKLQLFQRLLGDDLVGRAQGRFHDAAGSPEIGAAPVYSPKSGSGCSSGIAAKSILPIFNSFAASRLVNTTSMSWNRSLLLDFPFSSQ